MNGVETKDGLLRRWMWPLLCLALSPAGCGQNFSRTALAPGVPLIRVLLLENRQRVTLVARRTPVLQVGSVPRAYNAVSGQPLVVFLTAGGWIAGGTAVGAGELSLTPAEPGTLSIDGQAYRGRFRFVPAGPDRFNVVNDVDIDGYLKGVVAREMLHNWHDEAYRAQAIVARTYALYEARTTGIGRSWDLYADQRSQVYGGLGGESAQSRSAVDSTSGIVVGYGPPGREKIFKAYFSACCGGITQSASDAFGDLPSEPLSDQYTGSCCSASPRFNWGPLVIRKDELTRRMRAWGVAGNLPEKDIGAVARVDIQFTNRWGRPVRFAVTDARGFRYSLSGEDFRHAVNTGAADGMTLPSSFLQPVNEPDVIRFVGGHGFGHGVGLCQWCAEEQAASGIRHEDIVRKAYPRSRLIRAY